MQKKAEQEKALKGESGCAFVTKLRATTPEKMKHKFYEWAEGRVSRSIKKARL
jgi:hypothetical protein